MIKEVIKNQARADNQRVNDLVVYPSEEVLGSIKEVKEFGAFYEKNKKELQVVRTFYLMQYCDTLSFTPEQLTAYKMGLDSIVTFFSNACLDTESYLKQAESKQVG